MVLLSPIHVTNIVIDFPVGESFRLKVVCTQAEARAGQVEDVECCVFDVIHVAIIRIGCSFMVFLCKQSSCCPLTLDGMRARKVGRGLTLTLSIMLLFFLLRQNENQMPVPESL